MLKHNKKKNGRIVYEQLMQLATRLALTNHVQEAKYVLKIVKEYYKPGTMLWKEKKLFDSLLETSIESEEKAESIMIETLTEARSINYNKIEKERVNLINAIMDRIGKDLFSIPVKEYKLIASTQILFNEVNNNFKYSIPKERVKIKKMLVENMSKNQEIEESYEMDNFTYKILVQKFNEKYSPFINEDQKDILIGWIDYLLNEDQNKFSNLLKEKMLKAKSEIDISLIKEEHQDSEYFEMLKEAKSELKKEEIHLNEDFVHKIMRYYDLVDDLREIGNEKAQISQING